MPFWVIKPETIVCLSCKSELKYDFKDICLGSRFVVDKASSAKKRNDRNIC